MVREAALLEIVEEDRRRLEEAARRNAELNRAFEKVRQELEEQRTAAEELRKAKDAAEEAARELESANHKLEEALVGANQAAMLAQTVARRRSEFLAEMSHEIRTPMNGIMGMTALLLESELTAEQRTCAETVQDSSESLMKIVNDVLDLSKLEAGKIELENLHFDLRITLQSVLDLLAPKAGEKGLKLSSFIDAEVPSLLTGDPGRIRQVLINLLANAIRFTEKGEVSVRVTLDRDTGARAELRFEVRDTGIGIPADRIHRLFQSFSQADISTSRRFGGTGLGLSISKKLVRRMGGVIGVQSEPGDGSTFWFTLGLEKQPERAAKEECFEDLRGYRTLLVDDHPSNRFPLRGRLRAWGCVCEEAVSAEAALARLQSACLKGVPFQLAIVDMVLPDPDGIGLAARIRDDADLRGLVLVLLTSPGQRGDARRMEKAGFSAYLTKPATPKELYSCLALALGRKSSAAAPDPRPILTRHSVLEIEKQKARVLVADDDATNRRVLLAILERLGYRADAAADGEEAVAAWEKGGHEVILMDVEMPAMDGLEAARAIRAREGSGPKVSIIALTGHSGIDARERCLGAGMDDCVVKPVQAKDVSAAIQGQMEKRSRKEKVEPVFNRGELLDRLGGKEELLREVIQAFLKDVPVRMENLKKGVSEGEGAAVVYQAHTVKGAAANIGAERVRETAWELERAARRGDWERIRTSARALEIGMENLKVHLQRETRS